MIKPILKKGNCFLYMLLFKYHNPTARILVSWNKRSRVISFSASLNNRIGFSTNHKFKKFDPETIYPCIMRCQAKPQTKYWYGWVYYDGMVYSTYSTCNTLDEWIKYYGNAYRVTSMLQVWI